MHDTEHAGDGTTHVIIEPLDRSFVTPFDPEDIHRLAGRLDDVIDHIDAAVVSAGITTCADGQRCVELPATLTAVPGALTVLT
jgi:hypothetical protein